MLFCRYCVTFDGHKNAVQPPEIKKTTNRRIGLYNRHKCEINIAVEVFLKRLFVQQALVIGKLS